MCGARDTLSEVPIGRKYSDWRASSVCQTAVPSRKNSDWMVLLECVS